MKCKVSHIALIIVGVLFGACSSLPPLDESARTTQGKSIDPSNGDRIGDFLSTGKLSDGRIVAAYHNQNKAGLEIAVEQTAGARTFSRQNLSANGMIGYYNAVAVGPKDTVYVLTYNKTRKQLLAFKGKPSGNSIQFEDSVIVDDGATEGEPDNVGKWVSVAVDGNGVAHVAYYNATQKSLRYANNFEGVWTPRDINSDKSGGPAIANDDIGRYTSIAFGDNATMYIGFYNQSKGDAYLAVGQPGDPPQFSFYPVFSKGDVGKWIRIAWTKENGVTAAFYDETMGDLIVSRQSTDDYNFDSLRIDGDLHVGTDVSMAITSSGIIHVAFLAITNQTSAFDLKHAVIDGNDVKLKTIDQRGIVGFWNSIELVNNEPVFMYHLSSIQSPDPKEWREEDVLIYPR